MVRYNKVMFIVGMLAWWYRAGWRRQFEALSEHLHSLLDYFSFDLLLRTLFAPFRQISAGRVDGPLGVKLRAFFDGLISRAIGAMVRLTMIFVGSLVLIFYVISGGVIALLWIVVPLLPIIGLILMVSGWVPWHL